MHWLFRSCTIIDPQGPHHLKSLDIRVKEGVIAEIGADLVADSAQIYSAQGLHASVGWLDLEAEGGDPGYEQREDIESLARAARAGGYTQLGLRPSSQPTVQDKASVNYVKTRSAGLGVEILPIGAISHDHNGKDLTEMVDMHHAGAVAFSEGAGSVKEAGLMQRALLYVKSFGGLVMHQAFDRSIGGRGQLHEGIISTQLGIPGVPALAEELMIARDLQLLAYADSRLHFSHLSTAGAVEQVRKAKAQGLQVTASVAALNLLYTDNAMKEFSSHHKVLPPLRRESDRQALIAGLKDGTIDCVSSNHTPRDTEAKDLEFAYAAFGAAMLSTAFGVANTAINDELDISTIITLLTTKPRTVFGLAQPILAEGEVANLSFFAPDQEWVPKLSDIASKSKNAPAIGVPLHGRVYGTVLGSQLHWQ